MTASLHMISLQPDPIRLSIWATKHGISDRQEDMGYVLHAAMTAAFGTYTPKPFRWIQRRDRVEVYAYTTNRNLLIENAKTVAEPDVLQALGGLETLAAKEMPASWALNRPLGFEVRVCPTIRQDLNGDRSKSRERDAFLVACETRGGHDCKINRLEVYGEWLANRLATAAKLKTDNQPLRLVSFDLARLARRGQPTTASNKRPIRQIQFPDARIAGELIITNSDAFADILARGIGRHRSFGFGMLLLDPMS